jgi:hypothetical protein
MIMLDVMLYVLSGTLHEKAIRSQVQSDGGIPVDPCGRLPASLSTCPCGKDDLSGTLSAQAALSPPRPRQLSP